jgi:hypothetical protein
MPNKKITVKFNFSNPIIFMFSSTIFLLLNAIKTTEFTKPNNSILSPKLENLLAMQNQLYLEIDQSGLPEDKYTYLKQLINVPTVEKIHPIAEINKLIAERYLIEAKKKFQQD